MRWFAGCLMGLVACGGEAEPHLDGVRSGSRLRAVFIASGGDGARQFQTFHDRELGVDCWFQGDPPRCLPSITSVSLYADAGCSQPLLQLTPSTDICATLPDRIGVLDDCGGITGIFERGPETPTEVLFYVNPTTGECVGAPASQAFDYYPAGDELPLDGFVAGERRLEGEGRIQQEVMVGADGSRRPSGLHDRELDAWCWYEDAVKGCMPDFIWQGNFSDDLCSERIGRWYPTECYPTPLFTGRYDQDDTGRYTPTLQERGPSVEPAVLYTGDELACSPVDPDDESVYFLSGAAFDLDRLGFLDRIVAGEGRLQGVYVLAEDGLRHFDGSFYDHDLRTTCWPYRMVGDRWSCLPSLPWVSTYYFADPTCLEPIDVIDVYPDQPLGPATAWVEEGPCSYAARLHELGDELAPGSIYHLDGTCLEDAWDTAVVRRYEVGAETGFDDYVELTQITE